MKIAVQLGLLPGKTVADQAKWAKDHGVEGIEVSAFAGGVDVLQRQAEEINGLVQICSVCGNADKEGKTAFNFLHPDKEKREASIEGSKAMLEFCGQVGAAGQIVPPIFGPPVVPDLSPFQTPLQIEDELMAAALKELGPFAQAHNTLFLPEPLNRYEQHYLRKQSDGIRVIEKAGVGGVKLLSDLFHMHIEELNTPQALREAGQYVGHVHLADNTRMEPGTGDIDFVAAFTALKDIGFNGYMAYECGITGETPEERAASLATSLDFVRDCIAKA